MNIEWQEHLVKAGAVFNVAVDHQIDHFGNPELESRLILNGSAFFDLSENVLVRVSGDDASSFMQGQLSNDFNLVTEGHSQLSAYCSPKGRVLALTRVLLRDNQYYLILPKSLHEQTIKRLQMFVMMAKVELAVAQELITFGAAGPDIEKELAEIFDNIPRVPNEASNEAGATLLRVHGINPRFMIIAELKQAIKIWERLNVHAAPVGHSAAQLLKVLSGIPTFSPVSVDTYVPQMVNLEQLGALSFDKGCYPGQEIVARTHYLGKQKRRMYRVSWSADKNAEVGTQIYSEDNKNGEPVGTIVYSAPNVGGRIEGLAVLRIKVVDEGSALQLDGNSTAQLEVSPPPYGFDV